MIQETAPSQTSSPRNQKGRVISQRFTKTIEINRSPVRNSRATELEQSTKSQRRRFELVRSENRQMPRLEFSNFSRECCNGREIRRDLQREEAPATEEVN
ncbi:hypothetical protein ACFX1X_036275 [Malus domestica]